MKSDFDDTRVYKLDKLLCDTDKIVGKLRCVLDDCPLIVLISKWLRSTKCKSKYAFYFTEFFKRGVAQEFFVGGKEFTVGGFKHIRHTTAIDYIRKIEDLPRSTKEKMEHCYKSFLHYLDSISYGWFREQIYELKSSYKMSPNAAGRTPSFSEWKNFIGVLFSINVRDELIARCIIQGTRRVSEILNLKISQINFAKNTILFEKQSKYEEIVYDAQFISELRKYIDATTDQRKDSSLVFVTRAGKKIVRSRLNYVFEKASSKIAMKKVSPEILRATWLALKQQRYKDSTIMRRRCIEKTKKKVELVYTERLLSLVKGEE